MVFKTLVFRDMKTFTNIKVQNYLLISFLQRLWRYFIPKIRR